MNNVPWRIPADGEGQEQEEDDTGYSCGTKPSALPETGICSPAQWIVLFPQCLSSLEAWSSR